MQRRVAASPKVEMAEYFRIFGRKLQSLRLERGLTQGRLSETSSVQQSHLSKLERGVWEPRYATIINLAWALHVQPAELMPSLDCGHFPGRLRSDFAIDSPVGEISDHRRFFAETLQRLRKERGMLQSGLAERSSVSQPHVSALERGLWEPRMSTVISLCLAFNVQPDVLMPKLAFD